ncbi:undecaprenyl/decaprenyl-phosphate alpha-N-acetylglucosaminyl 1-phosphate transferase [Candidatus Berkelbacteria bacterium]|nr:undecaprenyl/decaprenyl-phosphate alpha-N-acetylglucosaminyl 1-phosphate transferase [Candidatus Berkelbacteria bacterium]
MTLELLLYGLIAFGLSLVATPLLKRFLVTKKIGLAVPRSRDTHQNALPRLGGLVVFFSFALVILGALVFNPESLKFVEQRVLIFDLNLLGVLLGALILVLVGVYDDVRDLNPLSKLLWQIAAAFLVVAFGVKIFWVTNPFGGIITLGNWTYLIVPLWLLLMINVMNWFDGLDGLAGGLSVIASIAIIFLALDPVVDQPATAMLAAILAGSVLGFLPYNWNPAKIFLGDTGSMFLGFMMGVFAIISGAKFATALLVLGIPVLDAIWVIARRALAGQSIMKADKKHLHHRFLEAGFSVRQTVIILYALAGAFGLVALATGTRGKIISIGVLVVVMVIMGSMLVLKARSRHQKETS